ncbi:hypothetical protein CGLO_16729 [Colletotrichum gloeosporioides Cg-14]|uniref:Uncharacterized protein n=1 Tax=Colletotrichum gloeosporioides (strain Cg-14) TaxID=1237896 RepID=T0JYF7_COLGC|nr:hypothetical protein CGLO_16729 [Colletotrichum gloeosporioides Cg-14]
MGADDYRERMGVIRLAIGQLGFTPQMLASNIKAFVSHIKQDIAQLDTHKDGPGFSLNGNFDSTEEKVTPQALSGVM